MSVSTPKCSNFVNLIQTELSCVAKQFINDTAKKIKYLTTTPEGKNEFRQILVDGAKGVFLIAIAGPTVLVSLKVKILNILGAENLPSPYLTMSTNHFIVMTPLILLISPIIEEIIFRGNLQETLRSELESFYANRFFSRFENATIAARVSSVFLTSVIFGLVHFGNAAEFWTNPTHFLSQVIYATAIGLLFSSAKDLSGGLSMPIGMHLTNNFMAWVRILRA